ncbi:protein disulfide-isomerase 2-like [Halichondria panicea]|uniref:protein disulfide-isomerase 2-like n=1 Tax=Halichondria panicea TaxID=6063 RepID=UPI00312BA989
MRSVLVLIALALTACVYAEVTEEENVLVLTTDNFEEVIEATDYVLVEFYAPWCGHCKSLAPEYAKAATTLKDEGSEIKLGKVDATEESDLAQQFGVKGYPTLKFFKNGKESDYSGGRTGIEIVNWLKKRTGPPAVVLESIEAANEFKDKDDVAVIGFFESQESDNAKAYLNAADTQDSINFGIVTSKDVAEGLEAVLDSIVLFKSFDEGRVTFSGEFNAEDIVTFVLTEQLPLVTKFSDETAPKIFGGAQQSHLLSFIDGDSEDFDTVMAGLRDVAKTFKGQVLFVHIDMSEDSALRVAEFFNIDADDVPTCRLINLEADMKKFVPEFEGIDMEKLGPWIQTYLDGELKAHLNSEDVPEDWNEDPVKVLVGKNFHEVVFDETKDVFVEFYAPWCGHCKQLAPIWDDLADHFKDDENIVIAKMDSTKNEVEDIQVQGFPTLKFIRSGTNEVMDYNGGRTLDDLIEFVEKTVAGEEVGTGEEEEEEDTTEEPAEEVKKDEL